MSCGLFPTRPSGRTYSRRACKSPSKTRQIFSRPSLTNVKIFADSPIAVSKKNRKTHVGNEPKKCQLLRSKNVINKAQVATGLECKKRNVKKGCLKDVSNLIEEKSPRLYVSTDLSGCGDSGTSNDARGLQFIPMTDQDSTKMITSTEEMGASTSKEVDPVSNTLKNACGFVEEASEGVRANSDLQTGQEIIKQGVCSTVTLDAAPDISNDQDESEALATSLVNEDTVLASRSGSSMTVLSTGLDTDTDGTGAYTYVWTTTSSDQALRSEDEEDYDSAPSIEIMRDGQERDCSIVPNPIEIHRLSFKGSKIIDELFSKRAQILSVPESDLKENSSSMNSFLGDAQARFNSTLMPGKQAKPIHAVTLPQNMSSIFHISTEKTDSFPIPKVSPGKTAEGNQRFPNKSLQNNLEKTPASLSTVSSMKAPGKSCKFRISKRGAGKPGCSTLLFQTQVASVDDFFPDLSKITGHSSDKAKAFTETIRKEQEIETFRYTQEQATVKASTPFQVGPKERSTGQPNHSKNLFNNDLSSVPPPSFGDSELAVLPASVEVNSGEIVVAELTAPVQDVEFPDVEVIGNPQISDPVQTVKAASARNRGRKRKKPKESNSPVMVSVPKKKNKRKMDGARIVSVDGNSKNRHLTTGRHCESRLSVPCEQPCILTVSDKRPTPKNKIRMSIKPLDAIFLKQEKEAPLDILCVNFRSKNVRMSTRCPTRRSQISAK